jgi:hypothetical protein
MRIRASYFAAALALAFAPNANATIVGSTYDFTSSVTGGVQISPLGGPTLHTDPANVGFCVGPPVACGTGSGVSGAYSFAKVTSTLDTITFNFAGSTNSVSGTFVIDLGNFKTVDGEVIKAISYVSGNFIGGFGDFSSVSFNGTDAKFTGSTSTFFDALGGTGPIVFDVTTALAVPEPASLALLGGALRLGFGVIRRRRNRV